MDLYLGTRVQFIEDLEIGGEEPYPRVVTRIDHDNAPLIYLCAPGSPTHLAKGDTWSGLWCTSSELVPVYWVEELLTTRFLIQVKIDIDKELSDGT